jgi:hypothetical protein
MTGNREPTPRWRRVALTVVKVVVVAAAFFVVKVLAANWAGFRAGWHRPAAGYAAAAAVALVATYLGLYRVSLAVLARLGWRLRFRAGLRPFFYTLLGRYIPGRVAVILGKVYLYERRGVPRTTAILAPAYENVFAAAGGLAASLGAAGIFLSTGFRWWQLAPAAAAVAALLLLIQRPILGRLLGFILRRWGGGGPGDLTLIPPSGAAAFALCYVAYCAGLGTFFAFLARAFVPLTPAAMAAAGAAFVAASFLGYAVVFAPSGVGVREGLLLVFLLPLMSAGDAAFLAVASRLVAVAAELLFAGAAFAAGNDEAASPRRAPPAPGDTND